MEAGVEIQWPPCPMAKACAQGDGRGCLALWHVEWPCSFFKTREQHREEVRLCNERLVARGMAEEIHRYSACKSRLEDGMATEKEEEERRAVEQMARERKSERQREERKAYWDD